MFTDSQRWQQPTTPVDEQHRTTYPLIAGDRSRVHPLTIGSGEVEGLGVGGGNVSPMTVGSGNVSPLIAGESVQRIDHPHG